LKKAPLDKLKTTFKKIQQILSHKFPFKWKIFTVNIIAIGTVRSVSILLIKYIPTYLFFVHLLDSSTSEHGSVEGLDGN
jgi:hypothetical protein